MNEKRFHINQLIITGVNLKPASIKFEKGLNVISGPSDTGKTFIFECIDYMFGADKKLKDIKEIEGYSEIWLEIETSYNKTYTIKRFINDKICLVYESAYKDITTAIIPLEVTLANNGKNKESLSDFLLKIIGIEKWNIRKNKDGGTKKFSFRDIVRLTMVDEEKIVKKDSVILNGQRTDVTANISVFRSLVTDTDDSLKDNKNNIQNSKEAINIKIEYIANKIEETSKKITELNCTDELIENLDYSEKIENLKSLVSSNSEIIQNKINERNKFIDKKECYEKTIIKNNELIKRFLLLKENYEADLQRLNFLEEGNFYLEQLPIINCPICHKEMIGNDNELNFQSIIKGCKNETKKIAEQREDLIATIESIKIENEETNLNKTIIEKSIELLDEEVTLTLKPNQITTSEEIEKYILNKSVVAQKQQLDKIKNELIIELKDLREDFKKPRIKLSYSNELDSKIYEEIENVIKNTLIAFKYVDENSIVKYNPKDNDIFINGESRMSHGKGIRALIYSSFIISLMDYLKNKKLKHTGIIILDSPLTTLKEKKNTTNEKNEDVNNTIQQSFFSYLADNFSDSQIIIFENKEPDKDVIKKINYINFTQNTEEGIYGFIPVK